jgi:LPS O-antigen subunit length determinant protein (WzzB/FepE family)
MSDLAEENRAPDLWDLVLLLWREKLVASAIVSVFAVAGIVYSLLATPIFRAEVVMTPAGQRSPASSLGQFSGLAALAGVNIGSGSSSVPLAVLRSREFAIDFIQAQGIEKALTAELNESTDELDMRDALDVFLRKVRVVSEDKKAGTVTLSIAWRDPQVAADWANAYVNRLNARLREQALAESERNVKFLQQEVASTTVVAMQQSLGRILEAEMQKYMLAKGEVEYAYKIVDRASAPKLRESPKRTLIVLLSVLLGGIAATLFVVFRSGIFSPSRSVKSSV